MVIKHIATVWLCEYQNMDFMEILGCNAQRVQGARSTSGEGLHTRGLTSTLYNFISNCNVRWHSCGAYMMHSCPDPIRVQKNPYVKAEESKEGEMKFLSSS